MTIENSDAENLAASQLMPTPFKGAWRLHIGFQKTGSTWLQNKIFPSIDDVVYFGKNKDASVSWIHEFVVGVYDDDDGTSFARARKRIDAQLAGYDAKTTFLLSVEGLVGNPWQGGGSSDRIAERLSQVFDNLRVLIVVRRQDDMLISLYKQYLLEGGVMTFSHMYEGKNDDVHFDPDFLKYDRLVSRYRALLGAERVCVLPHELSVSSPALFVGEVCRFFDLQPPLECDTWLKTVRTGYSDSQSYYIRWLNIFARLNVLADTQFPRLRKKMPLGLGWLNAGRLISYGASWDHKRGIHRQIMSDRLKAEIKERYCRSNDTLQAYTSIDLLAHGYEMSLKRK